LEPAPVMNTDLVKISLPSMQNRNGFMPSLEKRQHSIFSSCRHTKKKVGKRSQFQPSQQVNINKINLS
jgi:hypothetical protein